LDTDATDEVRGLDPDIPVADSITQFLQFPSLAPRARYGRSDPMVDFARFVILTSTNYEEAAMDVRVTREHAILEKARQW
jgi:hypothetical protein